MNNGIKVRGYRFSDKTRKTLHELTKKTGLTQDKITLKALRLLKKTLTKKPRTKGVDLPTPANPFQ